LFLLTRTKHWFNTVLSLFLTTVSYLLGFINCDEQHLFLANCYVFAAVNFIILQTRGLGS